MSVTKFIKRAHCIALVTLFSFVLLGSPGILTRAVAQDSETVPATTEAPAAPTPAETEMPVDPAPPIPTDVPAPTDVPVIVDTPVPPSVAVPTETIPAVAPTVTVPAETPTEIVTETEVVPTQVPPATPQPTVAPTAEPTPVITWSQTEQVTCELRDGVPAGLKYGQSRRYYCKVSADVASGSAMPADMKIEWVLDVNFADGYTLEFAQGTLTDVKTQEATSPTSTRYTLTQPWTQGSGKQELQFELVLTRTTCAIGEQVLTVQAAPTIFTESSEAEIKRQDGQIHPEPARVLSPVVNAEAPQIAFDGGISFEARTLFSDGLDSDRSRGTAVVLVTGDWDPCTTWTVNLSGIVDVPIQAPAQLRAVSINNEPISGDACDLSVPCDLIVLPETGTAATPLRYTIGLELKLHELTPGGEFGIGLQAEVHGAGEHP